MVRKFLAVFAAVLLIIAFRTPVAHATSDYDSAYQTTGSLPLPSVVPTNPTCPQLDLSSNWASVITDVDNWNQGSASVAPSYIQAFNDALDHGAWSVSSSQLVFPIIGNLAITAVWTTSHASLTWSSGLVGLQPDTGSVHAVSIYQGSSCEPEVTTLSLTQGTISEPSAVKNFLTAGDVDLNYPSGYEGEPVNQTYTPPAPTYVAMGDSFSSGEGNPPFEAGSDTSSDSCHRSPQAYPRLLEFDSSLSLGSTAFVACSGATTDDVINGKNGEPSQLDALSSTTQVVTITVGGNDVGFKDYVELCFAGSCGEDTDAYASIMSGIDDPYFELDLETTYLNILQDAPNAQVYVVDYPYLTAPDATSCGVFDFSGGRNVQMELNGVIQGAVSNVASIDDRVHYVDSNTSGSPFGGKYYCNGGTTDFNGLDVTHPEYSFHPNTQGQQDYAAVVKEAMQANS